eukprot:scaffold13938_cov109-Isochrysis_galbana.AAC.5
MWRIALLPCRCAPPLQARLACSRASAVLSTGTPPPLPLQRSTAAPPQPRARTPECGPRRAVAPLSPESGPSIPPPPRNASASDPTARPPGPATPPAALDGTQAGPAAAPPPPRAEDQLFCRACPPPPPPVQLPIQLPPSPPAPRPPALGPRAARLQPNQP